MAGLVHDLIYDAAARSPSAAALAYGEERLDYAALAQTVSNAAAVLLEAGVEPDERVVVFLEKRIENVAACFGAAGAGAAFVPVNPLLKPAQVAHIIADCGAAILVTSPERLHILAAVLATCPALRTILVAGTAEDVPAVAGKTIESWMRRARTRPAHPVSDTAMAAILYTSGSTGLPKGVMLSHRNLVAGAASVASYLELGASDRILAVLPLSFDYGFNQLTSAFYAGASVVLLNHLFPADIVKAVADEAITGLAAVPPLWIQLARVRWPVPCTLRFITSSGGMMPLATTRALRSALPEISLFLMYGLTEAFRSTFLPPCELERRPGSIGRAVPGAQVMAVRPDGVQCAPGEAGELVHRGPLVAMGYWNDAVRTAERFRPVPGASDIALWSGDTVRCDADGFFYFVGRSDDTIKVSGYRVSPSEIEAALHGTGLVVEVVAFGVPHPLLGHAVVVVAVAGEGVRVAALAAECRRLLPSYMVPMHIEIAPAPLARNHHGKFDRAAIRLPFMALFEGRCA